MKFIFASDSYKGTLNQKEICGILKDTAEIWFPEAETVSVPVSDGGEGAVEVLIDALGGTPRHTEVHDPVGKRIQAGYALLSQNQAIIEMAQASGLMLLSEEERNLRTANTFGTGELIRDAVEQGCTEMILTIGGSATNDGGIGCLSALGTVFLDADGEELEPKPENLIRIKEIDTTSMKRFLKNIHFTIMCDVKNPLTGRDGATRVYGWQKGGTQEIVDELELGMCHYAGVLKDITGMDVEHISGAGAAGGLGAGLLALTDAALVPGIDAILKLLHFDELLEGADYCITGEGRMDGQSMNGKAVYGVARACKKRNVPCIAIVGNTADGAETMLENGVVGIYRTTPVGMPLKIALSKSKELYVEACERLFQEIAKDMTP